MWRTRLKNANLVYSRTLHLQVTCEIQLPRQEVYGAYFDHTRLFQFRGCARSKSQFLTAVQSEIISQDASGLPAFQFWECDLVALSSKQSAGVYFDSELSTTIQWNSLLTVAHQTTLGTK